MTTHTTHTPGPWELQAGRCFKTCNGEFYLAYGKDKYDNPKFYSKEQGWSEMDANARLIAAAPELLEMLKLAQFAIGCFLSTQQPLINHAKHEQTEEGYYVENLLNDIQQAIAKAEGSDQ